MVIEGLLRIGRHVLEGYVAPLLSFSHLCDHGAQQATSSLDVIVIRVELCLAIRLFSQPIGTTNSARDRVASPSYTTAYRRAGSFCSFFNLCSILSTVLGLGLKLTEALSETVAFFFGEVLG